MSKTALHIRINKIPRAFSGLLADMCLTICRFLVVAGLLLKASMALAVADGCYEVFRKQSVGTELVGKLIGYELLNSRQRSDLSFVLDLVGARISPDGTLKARKPGQPQNPFHSVLARYLDEADLNHEGETIREQKFARLIDRILAIYNSRFSTPVEPQRVVREGIGEAYPLDVLVQNDLYRRAEQRYSDDWQMVGNLRDVRNPLMRGLRREIWWDRYQGDDPIGDVRISRQTSKLADGSEALHSVEIIRTFPDGTSVPFVFEVDAKGDLRPYKLNHENMMKVKKCLGCHSSPSGHFARVIKLNGYSPSPDWLIDDNNRLFPEHLPYEKRTPFAP